MCVKADVEVLFQFNGTRHGPTASGYRPDHLVKPGFVTTGEHFYYDVREVPPDGQARGAIRFLCPEMFPGCFWAGKEIPIREGTRVVGKGIVLRILNPILAADRQIDD